MLSIDLRGKRALVAGIADDGGYGFAIAKALTEAGATVCTGTWPPALNIFQNLLERGKMDESRKLADGSLLQFERIYPLDAEIRTNKRYKDVGDFSVDGLRQRLVADFGDQSLDIVIHSLANGPEVKNPLLATSRAGYLAAVSVSAYSLVSLVSRLGPLMRPTARCCRCRTWRVSGWCRATAAACRRPRRPWRATRGRWRTKRAASTACASTRFRQGRWHHAPPARSARSRRWSSTIRPTRPCLRS